MAGIYTDKEITDIYLQYADMVYRICFSYLKSKCDAEDAVQETFTRFIKSKKKITGDGHLKAWLIVTSSNVCKNHLKHWWNQSVSMDTYDMPSNQTEIETEHSDVLDAVLSLNAKERLIVYLYYYEGYSGSEISSITNLNESTIRNRLFCARQTLKKN